GLAGFKDAKRLARVVFRKRNAGFHPVVVDLYGVYVADQGSYCGKPGGMLGKFVGQPPDWLQCTAGTYLPLDMADKLGPAFDRPSRKVQCPWCKLVCPVFFQRERCFQDLEEAASVIF